MHSRNSIVRAARALVACWLAGSPGVAAAEDTTDPGAPSEVIQIQGEPSQPGQVRVDVMGSASAADAAKWVARAPGVEVVDNGPLGSQIQYSTLR